MHDDEPNAFAFTHLLPAKASATFCICWEKNRLIPAGGVLSGEVLSREDVPSELLLSLDDDNESVSDGLSELELYDVLVPKLSFDALLLVVIGVSLQSEVDDLL